MLCQNYILYFCILPENTQMDILTEELDISKTQLTFYANRLKRSRSGIYFLATIILLSTITRVINAYQEFSTMPSVDNLIQIGFFVLVIIFCMVSHKNPVAGFSILSCLFIAKTLLYLAGVVIQMKNMGEFFNPLNAITTLIFPGMIIFGIISATITARKFDQLQNMIKMQDGEA